MERRRRKKQTERRNLLHFVAFFHVASLSTGVDNEKALELTNSTVFHRGRQWKSSRAGQQNIFFHISAWFQYRNITQKCNKTSCCIMAWSRQTFWLELDFLLPKNESVLNILDYFLEQFQNFLKVYSLSKICKVVLWFILQTTRKSCSQPKMSDWARTYLQTPLGLPEFFPIGQWGLLYGSH